VILGFVGGYIGFGGLYIGELGLYMLEKLNLGYNWDTIGSKEKLQLLDVIGLMQLAFDFCCACF